MATQIVHKFSTVYASVQSGANSQIGPCHSHISPPNWSSFLQLMIEILSESSNMIPQDWNHVCQLMSTYVLKEQFYQSLLLVRTWRIAHGKDHATWVLKSVNVQMPARLVHGESIYSDGEFMGCILVIDTLVWLLVLLQLSLIVVGHFDIGGLWLGPEGGALLNLLDTLQQFLWSYSASDGHLLLPLIASDSLHVCIRISKTNVKNHKLCSVGLP